MEQDFRERFRNWLQTELLTIWKNPHPPKVISDDEEYELRRRFDISMHHGGWAGLTWPQEYGGQGGTLAQQLIIAEECVRLRAPEPFNRVALGIVGPALIAHGSEAQKAQHLPEILACTEVWCQGFSEPNAGSDLASLATRAVFDGTIWRISGQKTWTTLAQFADRCFLLARSNPGAPQHRGITAFIVPMRVPGVSVRPIRQINDSSEFSEVFFDDVEVSPDDVVGDVDGGWGVAMTALSFERSTNFAYRQVRLAREVEAAIDGFRSDENRVRDFTDRLVNVYIRSEALRHTVRAHLAKLQTGSPPGVATNASKVYWSETYQDLCDLELERAGVNGLSADFGENDTPNWERIYLSSRASTIYAGTSEIQRNIIAERGLGLPR